MIRNEFDREFIESGTLIWFPMMMIKYKVGFRKYQYLFDTNLAPSLNKRDLYVILLRNPKDIKVIESSETPIPGFKFEPKASSTDIINSLRTFRLELLNLLEESHENIALDQIKLAVGSLIWFMSPDDLRQYDANAQYYNMLIITINILNKIGFKKKKEVKILEEEVIYYPILIDEDTNDVYEPALKVERSESLTELLKLPEIQNIINSQIEKCKKTIS